MTPHSAIRVPHAQGDRPASTRAARPSRKWAMGDGRWARLPWWRRLFTRQRNLHVERHAARAHQKRNSADFRRHPIEELAYVRFALRVEGFRASGRTRPFLRASQLERGCDKLRHKRLIMTTRCRFGCNPTSRSRVATVAPRLRAKTRQNTPNARNTRLVTRITPTAHGRAGDRQPRPLGTKSQS